MKNTFKSLVLLLCVSITLLLFVACPDDSGGNNGGTTPPTDTTAPGNVAGLTATGGAAQVTLSWTKPSDSDYNGVTIAHRSGSTAPASCAAATGVTLVQVDGATAVMRAITGLTNGTEYSFRVCAKDSSGNRAAGVTKSATPTAAMAITVNGSNCSATGGGNAVDLIFGDGMYTNCMTDPISDDAEIGYFAWAQAADDVSHAVEASGGAASTSSFFRIALSDATSGWGGGGIALGSDRMATADVTGDNIVLWLKSTGTTTVDIQLEGVSPPAGGSGPKSAEHTMTGITSTWKEFTIPIASVNLQTLMPNAINKVLFVLKDVNGAAAGIGAQTIDVDEIRFVTPPPDTTAPGQVTAVVATPGAGQATLVWMKPSDADYNGVTIAYREGAAAPATCAAGSGVTLVQVDGATAVMRVITGLTGGTQYSFRVCAKDFAGNLAVVAAGTTASATPTAAMAVTINGNNCSATGGGNAVDLIFGDGTYTNCMTDPIANEMDNMGYFSFAANASEVSHTVEASGGADSTSSFYRVALSGGTSAWGGGGITLGANRMATVDATGKNIVLWLKSAEATTVNLELEGVGTPGTKSTQYTINGITNAWKEFTIPIGDITLGSLAANAINKVIFVLNDVNGATAGIGAQTVDVDEVRFVTPAPTVTLPAVPLSFDVGNSCIHVYGDDTTSCAASARTTLAMGTEIGTVAATIAGSTNAASYTITAGNTGTNYAINASTGVISTAKALSSLSSGTLATLTVSASVMGIPTPATVMVTITNNGAVYRDPNPPITRMTNAATPSALTVADATGASCDGGTGKCITSVYTSGAWGGFFYSLPNLSTTGLTNIVVRYNAPAAVTAFEVKIESTGNDEGAVTINATSTPALATGNWQTLTIPLTSFSLVANTIDAVGVWNQGANNTITVDEIYIN